MASSTLNPLRLPSIHPCRHHHQQTLRKPFSPYSSPTFLHSNTHRSTSKTPSLKLKATYNPLITHKQNPQFLRNPLLFTPPSEKKTTICMSSSSSSSYQQAQTIPAADRLVSVLVYLIPFMNSLNYGTYLFAKYHILELAFDPIVPLYSFYKSIPGVGLFVFLTLYIGIVRDRNFSRFVRFNSLQAMVIDFMLVVPGLARTLLMNADPMAEEVGLRFGLLKTSHDVTFIVMTAAFVYALWKCVLGRIPEFPGVTHAAEWQIFAIDRQL